MNGRRARALCFSVILGASACGYSEEEMRAARSAMEASRADAASARADQTKTKQDLAAEVVKVEELKAKLGDSGADRAADDPARVEAARAIEESRRRAAQLRSQQRRFDTLKRELAALSASGVEVHVRNNRITIVVPSRLLFAGDDDALGKQAAATLLPLATVLRSDPDLSVQSYQVIGHTGARDAAPKSRARVRDPLKTSLERARSVVVMLSLPSDRSGGGLAAARLSTVGRGDADPLHAEPSADVVDNDRVEVLLEPRPEEMPSLHALEP
jgi:flagellar motor protein MotB